MFNLIWNLIGGVLSIYLAVKFIPGVEFTGEIKYLVFAGIFLGLINFFIKPILKIITLPLKILTFGLIGLIINMLIIWVVDIFFPELDIKGLVPLFWTTLLVWGVGFLLGLSKPKKKVIYEETE